MKRFSLSLSLTLLTPSTISVQTDIINDITGDIQQAINDAHNPDYGRDYGGSRDDGW